MFENNFLVSRIARILRTIQLASTVKKTALKRKSVYGNVKINVINITNSLYKIL